jgi:transposase
VILSDQGRKELERRANSRSLPASDVQRAGMILACAQSRAIKEIAEDFRTTQATVIRWKNRFLELGLKGLGEKRRSGRPVHYGETFRRQVFEKLSEQAPAGYGQWDGALLAQALGTSKDAIWRLLKKERISLARRRTWCVSTDPAFAAKAADVVGLYLEPPEQALVISVDEKPNIQALERSQGYAVSSDHKLIQAMQSTYKRHGTLNLFAALEVATGFVHGQATRTEEKTKKGFLRFLEDVLAELPEANEYHVIMDNHSIHKRHEAWLEAHPNVYFHYTPTSASWLNMVEIWFGILSRKSLRGQSFSDTEQLRAHIEAFIAAYNPQATPFIWRKRDIRRGQLVNNLRNLYN